MRETIKLSRLKPNPNNPRVIRDHKFKQLCKSIEDFPKMMRHRPIVVDADYVILGGNMRLRALQFLGFREIPADWVSVASEFTEEEKPEFVIKDNTNFGEWDNEALANEWDDKPLEDWGHDVPTIGQDDEQYTQNIETPVYEPVNEKPNLTDLFDDEKTLSLIKDIEGAEISDSEKEFLIKAAQRHTVFNYQKIADYYSHASKKMQSLMEDSALVIIDFKKAIEKGYVELSNSITEIYLSDNG